MFILEKSKDIFSLELTTLWDCFTNIELFSHILLFSHQILSSFKLLGINTLQPLKR